MFASGCQTAPQRKHSRQPAPRPPLRLARQSPGTVRGARAPPGLAGCPVLGGWPHSSSCRGLIRPTGLGGTLGCSRGTPRLPLTQAPASPLEASPLVPTLGASPAEMQRAGGAGGGGGQPDPSLGQPRCPAPKDQTDPQGVIAPTPPAPLPRGAGRRLPPWFGVTSGC